MSKALEIPKTLLGIIAFFADEQRAFETVRDRRWLDGKVSCPICGSDRVRFMEAKHRWNCNGCRKQFSAKTGTIFEESPIPFSKWLPAMWLITNAKNGISSYELHRSIGVTQKTAWFMLHRIRLALQNGSIELVGGHVEIDETYIGAKARNMHKDKRPKGTGTGMVGKSAVMGFLERTGEVRTMHIERTDRAYMEAIIRANVEEGSHLYSEAHGSYRFLHKWFRHETVDHAKGYVAGFCHTNTLENYWSLLKRSLRGTYVSVEPFHLFRYLDEQTFRYNERHDDDRGRFFTALSQVVNRRVTYSQLTGKEYAAGA